MPPFVVFCRFCLDVRDLNLVYIVESIRSQLRLFSADVEQNNVSDVVLGDDFVVLVADYGNEPMLFMLLR